MSGSIFAAVISPNDLQAWFQLAGAIGATIVTVLSAVNLIWIMADRAKKKRPE